MKYNVKDFYLQDKLKGLKIGLLASLPSFLSFVLAVLARFSILPEIFYKLFKILNFHVFSINNIIFGTNPVLAQIPLWQFAVAILPLLIFQQTIL